MEGGIDMRRILKKAQLLLALMMILVTVSTSALASFDALVFSESMKVYASPSTSSKRLDRISFGSIVTVESVNGEWALISYDEGSYGFAKWESNLASLSAKKMKTKAIIPILYITADDKTPRWGLLPEDMPVYVRGSMGDDLALVSDENFSVLGYVLWNTIK